MAPVAVNGLIQGLVTVALEVVGLLAAIMIVRKGVGERCPAGGSLLRAASVVLGVVVLVIGAESVASSGTELVRSQRGGAGSVARLEYCLGEDHAQEYDPFVNWLRHHLPPHAVYEVADTGVPDPWCLALTLSPRLPARAGERAGWLIDIEDTSADLKARIADRDPGVQVYAPGLVLARLGR